MDRGEEREVRWPGKRIARRPGTESMMDRARRDRRDDAALYYNRWTSMDGVECGVECGLIVSRSRQI